MLAAVGPFPEAAFTARDQTSPTRGDTLLCSTIHRTQQGTPMAKFYVQLGLSQQLIQAEDARGAAIWAVHQVIDEAIDLDSIDWLDADEIDNLDLIRVMLALPDQVLVSEIGFGRSEAGLFDMPDIMTEWNQLIIAVSRIHQRFTAAEQRAQTDQ
jgi:hypothetical protein